MRRTLLLLPLLLVPLACGDDEPSMDATVRVDQIQVLGTHNSYHQRTPAELFDALTGFDRALAESLDYTQPPLTEQLRDLGARQLELDVFADPDGGLYSTHHLAPALGLPPTAEGRDQPGFKVLHVQEIDDSSSCPTFVGCLREVKGWSDSAPDHLPVMVIVEAKDDAIPDPLKVGFVTPVTIDAPLLRDLDAEIRSVFDDDSMLTPADLGDGPWPTLDDARGKVFFVLDNTNRIRDAYRTLDDPVLFTDGDGHFRKLNDPVADAAEIRSAIEAGQVVRTRADADTKQARTNDTSMREAALRSGAQYVSTDYLRPDTRFSDYSVAMPGGGTVRCNPVTAPKGCVDAKLEP